MVRVTKKIFKIFTKKQKIVAVFIIFLMLVGGIMESLSVSLILPLITAVTDETGWREKWYANFICGFFAIEDYRRYIEMLILMLILIFIVKNIFLLFEYYIQYAFISKSRYRLQHNLIHTYIRKPYIFFTSANSGEIIRIVTSDTSQAFQLLSSIFSFYTEMIVGGMVGITVFVMNPPIAIGLIVILLLELFLIARIIKPVMKKLGLRQRTESAITNKWLLQAINGIKSIKVTHTEDFFESNYCIHAKGYVETDRKYLTISNLPRLIIEAFTVAGVLFMMFLMVIGGVDLKSIVPQLSAFVVAAVRLLPSINRISSAINQTPFLEGGLDNVLKIINESDNDSLDGNDHKMLNRNCSELSFQNEIVFSEITFSYAGNKTKIFDRASFSIKLGQSVGIIGSSGAGKTTAIDIMLGLLRPDSGSILVDGDDIKNNMTSWLSRLAYIPQSIFLMDDTIRSNVAFGYESSEVSDEDIWKALKDAHLEEFVRSLPDGLDTKVGERGMRLSGGQQQRIGIARALYNNPDILFFDEATSALDNETEVEIMESIENLKGQKTMVIIAHRLSTIENCDVVYKVEHGKIVKER